MSIPDIHTLIELAMLCWRVCAPEVSPGLHAMHTSETVPGTEGVVLGTEGVVPGTEGVLPPPTVPVLPYKGVGGFDKQALKI